jgi:lysophospholipase L1-like esterase
MTEDARHMDTATETLLPVYVIGDSHALPYRNLIFRDRSTAQWVLARSKYVSGLTANDFFKPDTQEFHPEVISFLEYEGLVRNGRATHLSRDEIDFAIAKATGLPVAPPLILFTLGDIDIRLFPMAMLRDEYDFVPPFETAMPLLDKPLVPWDAIADVISQRISPFIAGLRRLRECGFNRIYVQSVVPPTRNEARIKEMHGYECPVTVRTKLVEAYNKRIAQECEAIGVTIVDQWPQMTENGYLHPALELDGVHMPPSAARWHLEAMLDHAINCQWFAVNHVHYDMYYRLACGLNPFQTGAGGTP